MFDVWNADKARLEHVGVIWALAVAYADALEARGYVCVIIAHG